MSPYEDKNLKDHLKEEKKKLKDMSFKDKIWYIWEYYKFPILAVIITAALVGSVGSAVYNNRFDTALSCMVLNAGYETDEEAVHNYFDTGFREFIGLDANTKIDVDYSSSISFDESRMNEYQYAELAKITAMVSSKGLDVMISTPDVFDHYGEIGAYMDLEAALPADLYELVKDSLYTVTNEETGEETACGICLENTSFEAKTTLKLDTPILGIMSNTANTDNCIELIRYMFSQ